MKPLPNLPACSALCFKAVSTEESMIKLIGLNKVYGKGSDAVHALRDVSLHVPQGKIFGVIGASGAGKSTLIRCVNLLERPTEGQVIVDGQDLVALSERDLTQARRQIGMIFQHFNLLASRTVSANIAFPLELAGWSKDKIQSRVSELLALVGLEARAHAYPSELSGGQKQRVGIARALATRPQILLCDEATSALDPQTTASVLDLLADLNRELGLTIVLITHEMEVVRRICDRVVVLDGGRVVEEGEVSEVFLHPRHPTTRTFLDDDAAVVERAQPGQQLLRVTLLGEQVHSPVLGATLREVGAEYFITSGRVDTLKQLPYGQVTLSVDARLSEAVVQRLAERGVHAQAVTP